MNTENPLAPKYIFVKASFNYADEFNCKIFGVFTEKAWNKILVDKKKQFDSGEEVEYGFGTNEELTFSSYEDWFRRLDIKTISKDQADVILKVFGEKLCGGCFSFGTGDRALTD